MRVGFYRSLFCALLLRTHVAVADDAASRETARALYAEATKLVAAKSPREALPKFEAAYAAMPTPIIGLAWARALESIGELLEARDRALQASLLPPQREETPRSATARKELADFLGELDKRVPKITISTGNRETELKLTLAAKPIEKALFGQALLRNPGKYELVATCGKETVHKATIDLKDSEHREVDLSLLASACTKKVAPTKGRRVSEGLIVGGSLNFVPYIALPPGDIPLSSKWSATAGLAPELGYAISPKLLLLLRGLISLGPQANPTFLISVGPTINFRMDVLPSGDPLWLSLSFHGGRAQTEFIGYPGKFNSDYVFASQIGLEVPFAEREDGYWYAGVGIGAIIANVNAKDTPFVFMPISLGVRSF